MVSISKKSLPELYELKPTPSVLKAILNKEDFSRISSDWCSKVCALTCSKKYETVSVDPTPVDILIIQSHNAVDERFRSGVEIESTYRDIISYLAAKCFPSNVTYRVTNMLKCTPVPEEFKAGSNALAEVKLKRCSPYLAKEISLSRPSAIISLSTQVSKALGLVTRSGKQVNNIKNRGEIFKGNIVVTQHPRITTMIRQNSSGAMWGSTYLSMIERDFKKAGDLASGNLVIPSLDSAIDALKTNNQVVICNTLSKAKEKLRELRDLPCNTICSFDIETSGLDPWASDAKILTAQFGYRRPDGLVESIVFPLWHRENNGYRPEDIWGELSLLLEDPDRLKVGHNLAFDVCYIAATKGVRLKGVIFDTMLLLHGINSGLQLNYGLKRAVHDFLPESGLGGYEDSLPELDDPDKEEGGEDNDTK